MTSAVDYVKGAGAFRHGHGVGRGQQGGEPLEAVGAWPVVDPGAAALAVDHAGLTEYAQVVGDRRAADVEVGCDVADADLVAGRGDDRHQPEPDRVGQRFEHGSALGGLDGVECRLADRRATTTATHFGLLFRHASILTSVYSRGNLGIVVR